MARFAGSVTANLVNYTSRHEVYIDRLPAAKLVSDEGKDDLTGPISEVVFCINGGVKSQG